MSTPRRAATILVLRESPASIDTVEVLLVRRGHRASFMANAYVFPGGRVDDGDSLPSPELTTQRCAARELQEEAGLRVDNLHELVPFARWITPSAEPKRFDTDFFLWALPVGQEPAVDAQEVFDLRWLSPQPPTRTRA
jgi:8-oxo-dGTP pyrophosphatase MutT (NUDIX family)